MIYEILKTLNLDTLEDKHTKVHDYVIKKFINLRFQLQWEHKCKVINMNVNEKT